MTANGPRPGQAGAWRWVVLAGLLAWGGSTALTVSGCGGALLTAPPGSGILIQANPTFIPANGGVSVITVGLIEPAGTYVPDGTWVQFFTNLGRIDRQAQTRDGFARANLVSDSRSGLATVTAVSGGEAPVTTAPPSTSVPTSSTITLPTTTTTLLRAAPQAFGQSGGAFGSAAEAVAAGRPSDTVQVTIGNPNVRNIQVRAVPPRIPPESNSTHVIATVLGLDGNPVANVPVQFFVDQDPATEFMDSAGRPIFTNQNGEAEDVMRTRRQFTGTAQVRAVVAGASAFVTGSVTIPIL